MSISLEIAKATATVEIRRHFPLRNFRQTTFALPIK